MGSGRGSSFTGDPGGGGRGKGTLERGSPLNRSSSGEPGGGSGFERKALGMSFFLMGAQLGHLE